MSWPDDNEPRFYVQTLAGYRIDPTLPTFPNPHPKEPPVTAAVLDRAYAHKIVREFIPHSSGGDGKPGGKGGKRVRSQDCLRLADALCAELNAQEDAGLLTEDAA